MNSYAEIWNQTLKMLSQKYSSVIMDLFFKDTELIFLSDKLGVIQNHNDNLRTALAQGYTDDVRQLLGEVIGYEVRLYFESAEKGPVDLSKYQYGDDYPLYSEEERTTACPNLSRRAATNTATSSIPAIRLKTSSSALPIPLPTPPVRRWPEKALRPATTLSLSTAIRALAKPTFCMRSSTKPSKTTPAPRLSMPRGRILRMRSLRPSPGPRR